MRYQCTKSLEKQLKFVYKYIIYENHLSFEKNNVGIEGWNSSDHLETMRRMSGSFLTVERETHSAHTPLMHCWSGSGAGRVVALHWVRREVDVLHSTPGEKNTNTRDRSFTRTMGALCASDTGCVCVCVCV